MFCILPGSPTCTAMQLARPCSLRLRRGRSRGCAQDFLLRSRFFGLQRDLTINPLETGGEASAHSSSVFSATNLADDADAALTLRDHRIVLLGRCHDRLAWLSQLRQLTHLQWTLELRQTARVGLRDVQHVLHCRSTYI